MKKLFLLVLIFPFITKAQNIYTVCNIPGSNANFKTLQGAHDTVPANSILYVLPSSFSYGEVVFTKKLTVYGTGFFLGQNVEPNTQAMTSPVYVNSITFRPGSDNSFVEGLQLSYLSQTQNEQRIVLDTVSNITISRCYILANRYGAYGGNNSFFILAGANNCIIKQCYILDDNGYQGPQMINYPPGNTVPNFSGIQFINNIFDWAAMGGNGFAIGPDGTGGFPNTGTKDVKFVNNTFIMYMKSARFGNFNFTNNIFVNTDTSAIIDNTGVYLNGTNLNNVTNVPNLFAVKGNNYETASVKTMFVSGQGGYHSIDQQWQLQAGSFANTYGLGGVAVGAFGGAAPYKLSGIPSIPFVYNLSVPAQATAPGTIAVHIKANASN